MKISGRGFRDLSIPPQGLDEHKGHDRLVIHTSPVGVTSKPMKGPEGADRPLHVYIPNDELAGDDRQSLRREMRDAAHYMALRGGPLSPEAVTLMTLLMNELVTPAEPVGKTTRPSSTLKDRVALGAMLADLLIAAADGEWAKRSIRNPSFTGQPVGRTAFEKVWKALEGAGMLDFRKGHRVQAWGFIGLVDAPPCFRATAKLIAFASDAGVTLEAIGSHFGFEKPVAAVAGKTGKVIPTGEVIVARAKGLEAPQGGAKLPGKPMALAGLNGRGEAQTQRMEALNAYLLDGDRVTGFAFGGFRRIFSNADQDGFDWQWGGRLYAQPGWDGYERWKGRSATRTRRIRIDGLPVVEVDISACHFTLLCGLLGVPFDPSQDPYAVEGFDRDDVKVWMNMALGAGKLSTGGNPKAKVRKAALAKHPVLQHVGEPGVDTLSLQFHESEILMSAMERLRDRGGILALPMHDALIVPEAFAEQGREALREAFMGYFGEGLGGDLIIIPRVS
jgi:hypothetical protein